MRNLCKRAEVAHFGAHSLRHFIATNFKDPQRAQEVLGHQNPKTTRIYLHDLEFEAITNQITNCQSSTNEKRGYLLQ